MSLEIVGRLLGHTQVTTTSPPRRQPAARGTERFGAMVSGRNTAEVVPLERGRKA